MIDKKTKAPFEPSKAVQGTIAANYFFAFVTLGVIIIVYLLHYTRELPTYFIFNARGQQAQVFPLDEPNVNTKTLLGWATLAATSAYTLNFVDYEENLRYLQDFFTVAGWENYRASLDSSGRLDDVISKSLVVSSVLAGAPVVLQEGPLKGNYAWRIQLPLLVTYQASGDSVAQTLAVTLLVTRVPTDEAPKGIGIAQFTDVGMQGT